LGVSISELKLQEQKTSDLLLSQLYQWQAALGVPICELLGDAGDALSPPVLERAQMLRLMKTVAAIRQRAEKLPIRRMAQMLTEQILDIMPELKDVSPWNAVGRRRTLDDLGQAAHRQLSLDAFTELLDQ
jgi:hypothetical protein